MPLLYVCDFSEPAHNFVQETGGRIDCMFRGKLNFKVDKHSCVYRGSNIMSIYNTAVTVLIIIIIIIVNTVAMITSLTIYRYIQLFWTSLHSLVSESTHGLVVWELVCPSGLGTGIMSSFSVYFQ